MSADEGPDVATTRMIGVVVARRKAISEWASDPVIVAPHAVLPEPPDLEPGAALGTVAGAELVYLGPSELTIWRGETGHYRDNLATGTPKIWVALSREGEDWRVHLTTANPYEGESLADSPGLVLEAAPMPADIALDLAIFIERHHVEERFVKRKRDKARRDPGRRNER